MNIDKSLILSKLKNFYSFKKDSDFARFLEIKPQTLASWYSRGTFDIELLYAKCNEISAQFLLTGAGEMLRVSPESNNSDEKIKELEDRIEFYKEKIEFVERKLQLCEDEKKRCKTIS
ncbi:helix-turn-helix domain-containing protein [Flavobacterium tructae]|uniref:helix-turn-helix domain-containing protein n=1 Tax=Flavobacterium tructae TaxID=1114873 RepID=UPI0025520D4E|nr:helix-turn-helix domain-containing protein [Flavobacterium tructae]MDL2141200.1 helix-turn-helix domain-containing protein [Flavobacterium tructae]